MARNLPAVLKQSLAGLETDFLFATDGFRLNPKDPITIAESRGTDPRTMYRLLEQDGRVYTTLQKRFTNLTRSEIVVEPGRRRGASTTLKDRKAAEMVEDQIAVMGKRMESALQGTFARAHFARGFESFTLGMLDALLMGYAVAEIIWSTDGSEIVASEIAVRDQRRFVFVKNGDEYELKLVTSLGMFNAEDLPPRKFLVYTWGSSDDPYGLGLGHRLYWPVFFKRRDLAYWVKFLERHGLPTVVGKHPPGEEQSKIDQLFKACKAVQSESIVTIPDNEMIDLIEAATTSVSTSGFDGLLREMNKAITLIVLGTELSTDIEQGGSRAATEVHSDLERERSVLDGVRLTEGPYQMLSNWITMFNFDGAVAPVIRRRFLKEDNLQQRVNILKTLSEMGFVPSLEFINDKFGDGGEEGVFEEKEMPAPSEPGPDPVPPDNREDEKELELVEDRQNGEA